MGILGIAVPFVFLVAFNEFIVFITKKSFGKCLPLSMMIEIVVLFFSQLILHSFNPGIILLCVLACAAVPLMIIFRKRYDLSETFASAGLISFVIIFVVYMIIDFHRHFSAFDEWYHWGMMVKEMMRLDKFYTVNESNLHIHKDYPPFISIFELLFCKLSGHYSEGRVSMGMHVFAVSFICPWITEEILKKKDSKLFGRIFVSVALFFSTLAVMLFFDPWHNRITSTILVDVLISLVFAYSFLVAWDRKRFGVFEAVCLIASNTCLVMIKQVGISFVMVITASIVLKNLFDWKKTEIKDKLINLGVIILSFATPLATNWIWGRYVKQFNIVGQFDLSLISFSEYWTALRGTEPGLRHDTLVSFGAALFNTKINQVSFFTVTYASAFVLIMALLLFLGYKFREVFSREKVIILMISFTCGTFGYAFMMSVLYTFCFNPAEMAQLASYNRYMATYVLAEILIILAIAVTSVDKIRLTLADAKKAMIIMCVFLVINAENLFYIAPQFIRADGHQIYAEYADVLASHVEPGSSVFVIYDKANSDQGWYGPMQIYMNYYNNDLRVDYSYNNSFEIDMNNADKKREVLDEILKNDYVYILDVNDNVRNLFSDYDIELTPGTVYRISEGSISVA